MDENYTSQINRVSNGFTVTTWGCMRGEPIYRTSIATTLENACQIILAHRDEIANSNPKINFDGFA